MNDDNRRLAEKFLPLIEEERLAFLSGLWLRLTKGLGCTEAEAERLTGGHDGYLAWKRGDTVRVIVPEGWGAHACN